MKTQDLVFASRPSLIGQQRLSYNGLDLVFSPYNDYWREMRKICVLHLFTLKRVKSYTPIREYEVSQMIEKISKLASASKLINLSEALMFLTSTIICRVAFGKRYEDEGCERSRFHGLLNDAQAMLGSFFFSDHFPLMKKQELEDITDVLIGLRKDNDFAIDITWDHIKGVLMNIFLGGTDTGAATVTWAMTALMKNPRVMKKAQEEVRNTFGKKGFIGEDDVEKLPYLKAVVKEAMRLLPPVPLLVPRETLQKCSIDGYEIPPKTLVFVNAWAIGRDPEAWENPEEFIPERFLGSSVDFRGQQYKLIPFGAGRRICPGLHIGVVTVELTLANLLHSFDWEMPPGMNKEDIDLDTLPGLEMHKKNAPCLVAKKFN
ncbi:Cytochrome P450 83B1 [Vitis vinifera]|uniref:Cytochrome P450 83B1 n=1 Tax=Vitis vinifera TaxID=29760 RepID=A0A438G785_VITVI|nr:Cytochrome P450 83B1 [Vitis vinifera]